MKALRSMRALATALALALLFVIVLRLDATWGQSVDMSHHYALTFRIYEHGHLGPEMDPSLGEMNIYPRASHVAAAVVGRFLGSPFLGLHIVTVAVLGMAWLGLFLMLRAMRPQAGVLAMPVLAALALPNILRHGLDLHGVEVLHNFFYPQLAGQGLMYMLMAGAIFLERRRGRRPALALLAAGVVALLSTHLLPAVELLAVLCGLVWVALLFEPPAGWPWAKRIGAGVAFTGVAGLAFLKHPSFAAMQLIGANDGSLDMARLSYPGGLMALCAVVLALGAWLAWGWWRSPDRAADIPRKYLALMGLSMAALCILQYVLLKLGQGSNYAVKKYVFGLSSFALVAVACLVGEALARGVPRRWADALQNPLLLVSFMAVFLAATSHSKILDVGNIMALERQLVAVSDTSVPAPPRGRSNVVIGLPGVHTTVNYMFTLAVGHTRIEHAIPDVLRADRLDDLSRYAYVISGAHNPRFGPSESCRSLTTGTISVVPAECLRNRTVERQDCPAEFDFTDPNALPVILRGFDEPEPAGRWTKAHDAAIGCKLPAGPARKLRMTVVPFLYGPLQQQRLVVRINGKPAGEQLFTHHQQYQLAFDLPATTAPAPLLVELSLPDAKSPKDVGLSPDIRPLGINVERVRFTGAEGGSGGRTP